MDNIETKYVKDTYNQIATDFDRTRYNQWSTVKKFIEMLPVNSLVLDAGCGNGKNMIFENIQFVGCDICENFVEICQKKGFNVVLSSVTSMPFQNNMFDAVMSIAVLHHIYQKDDLMRALNELIRVVKNNGLIHFTVWAKEQKLTEKFIPIDDKGNYFVTWKDKITREVVGKRFYHLFSKTEIDELLYSLKNIKIMDVKFECDNWNVTLQKI